MWWEAAFSTPEFLLHWAEEMRGSIIRQRPFVGSVGWVGPSERPSEARLLVWDADSDATATATVFILSTAVLNSELGMIQVCVDFIIPIKYFM